MIPGVDWSTVLAAGITAVVALIVGWLGARGKRREDTQLLIDQLQEERNIYAKALGEEREAHNIRLDRMWTDKAMSRAYVAQLRTHIYQGNPPPPPAPPEGYIE